MIFDKVENAKQYLGIHPRLDKVLKILIDPFFRGFDQGKHQIESDEIFVLVNNYETNDKNMNILEAHKKYIDVQFVLKGSERVNFEILANQYVEKEYSKSEDYAFYSPNNKTSLILNEREFAVFFPQDLHMPGLINNSSSQITKLVFKVLID